MLKTIDQFIRIFCASAIFGVVFCICMATKFVAGIGIYLGGIAHNIQYPPTKGDNNDV